MARAQTPSRERQQDREGSPRRARDTHGIRVYSTEEGAGRLITFDADEPEPCPPLRLGSLPRSSSPREAS